MGLRCLRYVVWLAAAPLFGATIDVSGLSEVTLHPGDALSFAITALSYNAHAAKYGAPAYPAAVSFNLVSAPTGEAFSLSAEIEAGDGSASASFSELSNDAAYMQGVKYRGPATSIHGSLQLSPEASRAIFTGPAARLVLRNTGGDVTLGLSPYTLRQDLLVTVSGGVLQVGAVVVGASLESYDAAPASYSLARAGEFAGPGPAQSVPEPSPASLIFCGALFWALARVTKRWGRGGIRQ
jgi:hypothetical protein